MVAPVAPVVTSLRGEDTDFGLPKIIPLLRHCQITSQYKHKQCQHSLKLQTLMAWKRYILHIGHDEEVYWEIKIMFHGYEN